MIIVNSHFSTKSTEPVDISNLFSYDSNIISNFEAWKFGNIVYLSFKQAGTFGIITSITVDSSIIPKISTYIYPNAVYFLDGSGNSNFGAPQNSVFFNNKGYIANSAYYGGVFYYCFQIL